MNNSPQKKPGIFFLLGIPFHDVTMQETLDQIDELVARRKPSYLATANLDFAAQASQDVELQRILFEAELVLCDGTPLIWASKWLGAPLRERVAGSDLVPKLFAHSEKKGYRIFFLGSSADTLIEATKKCASQYPALNICGSYSPPYAKLLDMNDSEIERQILKARPDILLVALGCPKQEKWIYKNYNHLGVPVMIGVGATLDFIAGKFKRAPVWMRGAGLEWVFRLSQEPRRLFSRYFIDLIYFVTTLRMERRLLKGKAVRTPPESERIENPAFRRVLVYAWSGRIDAAAVQTGKVPPIQPETANTNVLLDCSRIDFIDSTGLGLLIQCFRNCKSNKGTFVLLNPSKPLEKMLSMMKLNRLLPIAHTEEEAQTLFESTSPATPQMSSFNRDSHTLTIPLSGELTAATVPVCQGLLFSAWEDAPGATTLSIDLSKVSFIDSSGLGLLIKALKLVKLRPEATMTLIHPAPNVLNVIHLANLGPLLGIPKNQ